jgi:hypothetical protein
MSVLRRLALVLVLVGLAVIVATSGCSTDQETAEPFVGNWTMAPRGDGVLAIRKQGGSYQWSLAGDVPGAPWLSATRDGDALIVRWADIQGSEPRPAGAGEPYCTLTCAAGGDRLTLRSYYGASFQYQRVDTPPSTLPNSPSASMSPPQH